MLTQTCCLIKEFTLLSEDDVIVPICLPGYVLSIFEAAANAHVLLFAFQVHKMIAEFRLIPGLNNLFDKLIWRKHSASALVLHGHNQNCDCSPVSNFLNPVLGFSLT